MISVRIVDGPHAKMKAVALPVDCFEVAGEYATVRFHLWPQGGPTCTEPGERIAVHEYRIAAAAITAPRGGRNGGIAVLRTC